ncbi:MAG TPA: response regulator [Gemmatimonadales bacterium]|nr:response regulator [Gemmatimonadales bacterium]
MAGLVLVIDDDVVERELLHRCLAAAGYRVLLASDGEAGLDVATRQSPDLILLDVVMPNLNGFQTCRRLRQQPGTAATPIVMLTSKDQDADRYWADQVGVSAYLTKPVDVSLLLATAAELAPPP